MPTATTEYDTVYPRFESQSAALHSLMTQFVRTQCPRAALAIVQHLEAILARPELDAEQQELYEDLFEYWGTLAKEIVQHQLTIKRRKMAQAAKVIH